MNPCITHSRWIAIGLVFLSLLSGCVEVRSPEEKQFTREWKAGDYLVRFSVVPKGTSNGRYAYYTVSTISGGPDSRTIIASAHSIGGFQSTTDTEPKNHIRIVEDAGGGRILIEEDIPNSVAPCKNYILVHTEAKDRIRFRYLQLPEISTGLGGVDTQLPTVTRWEGKWITYLYPNGNEITREIEDIESSSEPNHAG
jgi:hypothetical protein